MPELRLTVSPEARDETVKFLRHLAAWTIAGTKDAIALWCAQRAAELLRLYPSNAKEAPILVYRDPHGVLRTFARMEHSKGAYVSGCLKGYGDMLILETEDASHA